ncbi:insulin receptor substrate 1-B isoform X3 [Hippocampus comes]|uniref:insulin receptor substrate 1-B isoform X3 n=1 Tax=Hippocampus comes TaxID=109280 RepID=UPI00094E89A5|nr:PREDICTED: insulin receptor substrate 1-B-like isoform X3 [Hippocampus comes]
MSSANSPRGHDASPGRGALVAGDAMDGQAAERGEDVRKSGYLRKHKSMHRRYFVLRSGTERGAARLEYYESEKKFRGKAPVPKKAVLLETCFNINKRADSKNKHMIVLYTRAESFAVAADNEADQDDWYQAMVDLQCKSKNPSDKGAAGDYGVPNPGPAFKEVWQVKVWPKGLGQAKNLVGIYRLCLTDKTINFVKLNSDAAAVVLQLMNVRRCGHSENFFFVEVGRSAVTGPGEFWMQVDDSVVAQNMHETLLEAMKALSEEFRQRSKSQSNSGPGGGATASNPISVPTRRHHSNPPPSQVGFTRRPRTEPPGGANGGAGASGAGASPTPRHSFPRSRAASDGSKNEEGLAGLAGSSPSANGSCSGTPVLRSKLTRSGPASTAKTPLGLMRSISTPAPSPGPSLSSSSGHGSEFGGVVRCASVSGSPSDYGSSDEYGSSPGEQTLLVSPVLPGSSAGSAGSQSLGEDGAHYILMGQHSGGSGSHRSGVTSSSLPAAVCGSQAQTRRVLRRSSSRECEAERRLLSKRASLPPMALERLLPCQQRAEEPAEEDSADYAIMSRSASRESFSSTSSAAQREAPMGAGSAEGGGAYFDLAGEFKGEAGSAGAVDVALDNGYMSMLPGVTQPPAPSSQSPAISVPDPDPKPPDDYMAMTPNSSVSPPQQIRPPPASDGYMIMSPSSSCSPDQRGGLSSGAWVGSGSADSRAGSDYMNMSPISARSVNGSPPPSGHSRSEQPVPKMVYSYYSLPRSYKHNPPSRHFDDGAGRGRRPHGSGVGGAARTVGGHPEQTAAGASTPGRHLSLSSSSYSSSSASSESLGESEERASKDGTNLQQRRGSGGAPKHGIHSRSRPVSLFVDVSKANTLPRVRENPLPPEPKSPGEYVSIEFKGENGNAAGARGRGLGRGSSSPRATDDRHPQHGPVSCLGAFAAGSRSRSGPVTPPAASEYVNMDLGASPSPSPHAPLVFPPFHSPPTPPTLAPASGVAESGPGGPREEAAAATAGAALRKMREIVPESRCPASCGDYTVMAFDLNANAAAGSSSPEAPSPNRTELPVAPRGLDFPLAKSGPNPDHGAKVIRADPQGRRRHCSESFLASSSLSAPAPTPSSSAASLSPEQAGPRRPGFESAPWRNCAVSDAPAQSALPGQRPATPTAAAEQGLNYIDLDLANKESPHLAPDGPPGSQASARLFSALGAGSSAVRAGAAAVGDGGAGVNSYASIDFCKSEELRMHPNGNKEGTEC